MGRAARTGPDGLDIGYGAPWEADPQGGLSLAEVRPHLWRNRPCCFLHFVIAKLQGRVPSSARPRVLGDRHGRLLPATGRYFQGPYFGNHVRFFFRDHGVAYVATLHTFGERRTERLLGRIVAGLRRSDRLPRGGRPQDPVVGAHSIAVGLGGVWAAGSGDPIHNFSDPRPFTRPRVVRLDPRTGRVDASLRMRSVDLALGKGSVWFPSYSRGRLAVIRVNPETLRVVSAIRTGTWPHSVAVGAGGVWVANSAPFFRRGSLVRIDPRTNRVSGRPVPLGRAPARIAVGAGGVWVTDALDRTVTRVDPDGRRVVARIRVGRQPYGVAVGASSVWVSNVDDGTVSRIDPRRNRVVATIRVGRSPYGLATTAGAVWVADLGDGTVARIDPRTNRVVRRLHLGGEPLAVAASGSSVWVAGNSEGRISRLAP
jgi:YVTN family beta-propeller protein